LPFEKFFSKLDIEMGNGEERKKAGERKGAGVSVRTGASRTCAPLPLPE